MNNLRETPNRAAETTLYKEFDLQMNGRISAEELDLLAQKWAVYCVKELRDNTLARGLDISKALVAFIEELKHPTA